MCYGANKRIFYTRVLSDAGERAKPVVELLAVATGQLLDREDVQLVQVGGNGRTDATKVGETASARHDGNQFRSLCLEAERSCDPQKVAGAYWENVVLC